MKAIYDALHSPYSGCDDGRFDTNQPKSDLCKFPIPRIITFDADRKAENREEKAASDNDADCNGPKVDDACLASINRAKIRSSHCRAPSKKTTKEKNDNFSGARTLICCQRCIHNLQSFCFCMTMPYNLDLGMSKSE
jgi:hypothetical protein